MLVLGDGVVLQRAMRSMWSTRCSKGGEFSEVYADATVGWPLLVRGVIEWLAKRQ